MTGASPVDLRVRHCRQKGNTVSNETTMVYVAADPTQPGAAWAIVVDDGKHPKDVAKSVAKWVREGANVMRVDIDTGREMLLKWERPAKKQAALL
jgi:hypothetical protein